MDRLTLFGLFAVTAMLLTYAFESRGSRYVLLFAGSCVLGSNLRIPARRMAFRDGGSGVVRVAIRRWWSIRG